MIIEMLRVSHSPVFQMEFIQGMADRGDFFFLVGAPPDFVTKFIMCRKRRFLIRNPNIVRMNAHHIYTLEFHFGYLVRTFFSIDVFQAFQPFSHYAGPQIIHDDTFDKVIIPKCGGNQP